MENALPTKIHSSTPFQSFFHSLFLPSSPPFPLKTYSREFPRFLIWYLLRIAFLTRRCRYFPELRGGDLPKRFKSKDRGIKLENQIARRKRNEIAIFPSHPVEEAKVSLSLSLSSCSLQLSLTIFVAISWPSFQKFLASLSPARGRL